MPPTNKSSENWIDRLNERIGRFTSWLVFAVILLGAWNAVTRYISKFTELNISSNAHLELQWYLFSAIFLLGGAYTLKRDEHVRVDVLHAKMRPAVRNRIDLIGNIVFLIPFCIFIIWTSWYPVRNSWKILEASSDPGGLPRYPIKTLIPLAFLLVLLQAISMLIKRSSSQQPTSNLQHPTSNESDKDYNIFQNQNSKIQNREGES
jgi:TRAP-type mannitol/chloroaromatic compound transport system permease small subunit